MQCFEGALTTIRGCGGVTSLFKRLLMMVSSQVPASSFKSMHSVKPVGMPICQGPMITLTVSGAITGLGLTIRRYDRKPQIH